MVVLMTLLFVFIMLYYPQLINQLKIWMVWIWNAIFVIAFVLMLFVNQISFPQTLGNYPIVAPLTDIIHYLPLIIMLILFPIILIDFTLLSRELLKMKPILTTRNLGLSFTMGGLFMLLMLFALLFTSTWGFIPIIGVFFRDMFWLVFFIVGGFGVLSLMHVSENTFSFKKSSIHYKTKLLTACMMIVLCMGTIVGVLLIEAHPVAPEDAVTSLRILNYNIQQGNTEQASKNYDGQLELIRNINADIIGLQETSKIAGNSDPVRYFANKLNLYSYFGPKGVTGTTGVALLSKYPIRNPKTIYHFSENVDRKQTATIEAEITVQGKTFTIYNTHTYGRVSAKSILQQDVLTRSEGKENIIFIGDFNFRPNSEVYNLTTATLNDTWEIAETRGVDTSNGPEFNVSRRVELIFTSPGMTITNCLFITDPQSDHPAYWAEIQL
jgi:endonuclease/exonuclease/phosphatase family metal-dependent hydrolase